MHCELRHALTAEVRAAGSFEDWFFFHDGDDEDGDDLDRWAAGHDGNAIWALLRPLEAVAVTVGRDSA